MNDKVKALLAGHTDGHLMPFFWQHGEDETTLRRYMQAIDETNCRAVCVESRPHPDFCGPKWWQDMDVILDEARRRGMKVWILDDSHFPTGYANGALKDAPPELHRQSVCATILHLEGQAETVTLPLDGLIPPSYPPMGPMEEFALPAMMPDPPHFDDDQVIALTAVKEGTGEAVYIPYAGEDTVTWQKPAGNWNVYVIGLSRNLGYRREYMNMMDERACRLLIDAVYAPHWAHYQADFGKTIAGFFSDEPDLGNGHLFWFDNPLGTDQDLPFANTLPPLLEEALGEHWANRLYLLWDNAADPRKTARLRYTYMDTVTRQVRSCFSRQVGRWCREHGVKYIGHLIEDGNAHARTGASLGHYFRGLDGQDMAGIDDIGGQVLPQGEDGPDTGTMGQKRDGEFYHFMLGNLAASAAAIEPKKHGDAMCEIFGAYGWAEGLRLEKYLADHFMVRGINHFVPHAFSPAPFPDPDCPPHFYAHGHNPQYRHFGRLMAYMDRVCTLISGGRRLSRAAVLYHGEAEWAGTAMLTQKIARPLTEAQIQFDTLPCDVFAEPDRYHTQTQRGLQVNGQTYRLLLVPASQFLPSAAAHALAGLIEQGFPVLFVGGAPQGLSDSDAPLPKALQQAQALPLGQVVSAAEQAGARDAALAPADSFVRVLHYQGDVALYYFVNEGTIPYIGTAELPETGPCYWYDPWENTIFPAQINSGSLSLCLEPLRGYLLILDEPDPSLLKAPVTPGCKELPLAPWQRSTCQSIEYPTFGPAKAVTLPDRLAEEQPTFSGFVRYDSAFTYSSGQLTLEVTNAMEGVEVFVNGQTAGIQIVPPFRYDLTALARPGENTLRIEVATTLERWAYTVSKDDPTAQFMGVQEPTCGSGITGEVKLTVQT